MLKYITLFAALGAVVLAQDSLMDDLLLEQEMQLPCTPKPCVPICKPVTKYVSYGSFKLPYTENVCVDDKACLTTNAKCIATLQAAMKAAEAAEKDMIAKAKLANSAKATKANKDAAAAAKKVEEAKAKAALDAGKAAFEVAEKETATAKAALARAEAAFKAKDAVMNTRLKEFETAKAGHLTAQKAYANARGEAAKAADAYNAAVKAHCDAEAVHAAAVEHIGHGHFKKDECKKHMTCTAGALKFKSATQSGNQHGHNQATYGARSAIDGNTGSRQGIEGSWTGDFGSTKKLSELNIIWEACQCKGKGSILIDCSTDGKTWKRFASEGGWHQWGGKVSRPALKGSCDARYVRITGKKPPMQNGWMSMFEVTAKGC